MSVSRRARLGTLVTSIILVALTLRAQSQAPVVVSAQPNTPVLTSTGTAAITGTVVDATNGRPMASAIVKLEERRSGLTVRSSLQATTPKGRFAFVDLPASESYFLTASKLGYLDGGYGRPDPRGPSAPIVLSDGQWLSDVRVTMSPPGSLSGAVMDERGEPIVGAYVRLLSQVLIGGETQWLAGAVTRTDDRGAYRIPGLGPGRYVVSVPSVQATLPASATVKPPGASAGTSMADLTAALDTGLPNGWWSTSGAGSSWWWAGTPCRRRRCPTVSARRTPSRSIRTGQRRLTHRRLSSGSVSSAPVSTSNCNRFPRRACRAWCRGHLTRSAICNSVSFRSGSRSSDREARQPRRSRWLTGDSRSSMCHTAVTCSILRHTLLELTYTSMDEVPTALPAPVPFSARSASSSSIKAAPPGVEYFVLEGRRGRDVLGTASCGRVGTEHRGSRPANAAFRDAERTVRMGGRCRALQRRAHHCLPWSLRTADVRLVCRLCRAARVAIRRRSRLMA